jgi:DNA mismatch repair protein MSH6
LFRIWLTCPLRDIETINARLDAVDDLIKEPSFSGSFTRFAKDLPDLEVSSLILRRRHCLDGS